MEINDVMVEFDKYCKDCKHCEKKGFYDPCNDCLDNPVNTNSEKPMYFEKNEEKEDEQK